MRGRRRGDHGASGGVGGPQGSGDEPEVVIALEIVLTPFVVLVGAWLTGSSITNAFIVTAILLMGGVVPSFGRWLATPPRTAGEAWMALLHNDLLRARELLQEDQPAAASARLDAAASNLAQAERPEIHAKIVGKQACLSDML